MIDVDDGSTAGDLLGRMLRPRVAGDVLTDRFSLTAYSTAACIYKIRPLAVVVPKDAADVAATVRTAAEMGVPITPRGAGSGLCGQALGHGIILDFTKYMNRIGPIDATAGTVRAEPGAVTGRVNEALAAHNLMLGPDPSSEPFCTIGGNLGNNASGSRGIRYGSMKDYVEWLDVVLADGSTARLSPLALDGPQLAELTTRNDLLGHIAHGTRRLVADNTALIDRYRPHIGKNSAGYNLFEVVRDGLLDLTRLVVGSEGTLALVVEACLRAVPKPPQRASVLLWFDSLEKAGQAVPEVLATGPSACEIMERHFLDIVRADGSVARRYLPAEADTVLLVEFLSDSRQQNEASVAAVRRRITDELRLAFGAIEAYDPVEQERLWMVRKRAVQILQRLPGPRRITPFVEDVVVPPARLVEYIKGLRDIFERFGVEAAVYGHAGDSNLHARPLLDLRKAEDVARMKGIAEAVARLTIDLGGTISCEHGDGLTRSGYLDLQFGDLYDVMRQVKRLWDPQSILNPGKVITDERQIHVGDLRMGPDYSPRPTGAAFDREPWTTQLGRCHGCGTCRAYCPVFRVTGDELASPRGKANLLRSLVSGDLPWEDAADAKMQAVADLCYNCKTCLVECPSQVNVAGLVLKHKEHLVRKRGLRLVERLMLQVRWMGRAGRLTAPLANALLRWRPMRAVMERLGGIGRNAPLPPFAPDGLSEGLSIAPAEPAARVAYFAGCFELFNVPRIGRATLAVLDALRCEVVIPEQKCCGVPKISAGNVRGALADMRWNLERLAPLAKAGFTVASGCPSCVLALTDDYPELAQGDPRAVTVARQTEDVLVLVERLAAGRPVARSRWNQRRLAYHAPCHLRAAGRGDQPRRLLEKVLGIEFVIVNPRCCGMGGTFGLKARNATLSQAIARETFDRILAARPDAIITSCGMCRTQLAQGTGLPVYHPIELLADVLAPATKPVGAGA